MSDNYGLSQREQEIIILVIKGHSNDQIAKQIGISVGTVKRHLININRSLGAQSRTQAAWFAICQGIVACPCQLKVDGVDEVVYCALSTTVS